MEEVPIRTRVSMKGGDVKVLDPLIICYLGTSLWEQRTLENEMMAILNNFSVLSGQMLAKNERMQYIRILCSCSYPSSL